MITQSVTGIKLGEFSEIGSFSDVINKSPFHGVQGVVGSNPAVPTIKHSISKRISRYCDHSRSTAIYLNLPRFTAIYRELRDKFGTSPDLSIRTASRYPRAHYQQGGAETIFRASVENCVACWFAPCRCRAVA